MRYVVFPVTNDGSDIETFDIIITFLSVTVDDVIDGTLVVFLEYVDVQDVLSDEQFVGHANNLVFTVFVEDDYIVDVGTVAYIFVFLQSVPMKPSSRLIYSFSLASATLVATIVSKLRISVRRGKFLPYFSFRR